MDHITVLYATQSCKKVERKEKRNIRKPYVHTPPFDNVRLASRKSYRSVGAKKEQACVTEFATFELATGLPVARVRSEHCARARNMKYEKGREITQM